MRRNFTAPAAADAAVLLTKPMTSRDRSSLKGNDAEGERAPADCHGQFMLSNSEVSVALWRLTVFASNCTTSSASTMYCGDGLASRAPLLLPHNIRTCVRPPSEQSHVPDRCSCKIRTRHAEPSRRPQVLFTRYALDKCSARHQSKECSSHWQQPAQASCTHWEPAARLQRKSFKCEMKLRLSSKLLLLLLLVLLRCCCC